MPEPCYVEGDVAAAPFTLKIHRGEGMVLLAMNWRNGQPPGDFVGFSIEYSYPQESVFWPVKNRITFPGKAVPPPPGKPAEQYPSTEAPFQMFRWVHFPRIADTPGEFTYRVTPKFMNAEGVLSAGTAQLAKIVLYAETYPGILNVAFTRGYISSQAFVDRFGGAAGFDKLIPANADDGNDFTPTHPKAGEAYDWMGFEARQRIIEVLDAAIDDGADVMVAAFELNLPELIERLAQIGPKLRIIIDNSSNLKKGKNGTVTGKDKADPNSPESRAGAALAAKGAEVRRQHMGNLQHNKMIIVDGPQVKRVVLGSTNFTWRGFFVQSNNAVIVYGQKIVDQQRKAFQAYWDSNGSAAAFGKSPAADWESLQVDGLDGKVSMCPHSSSHSTQAAIATDIGSTQSSLFFSLAFLYQTPGNVTQAIDAAMNKPGLFVYGVSDKRTGIIVHQPDGNPAPVYAAALTKGLPEPFRSEASGGSGVKMHHKFVVIDFNKPTARVYTGSYNFSHAADVENGENLVLVNDQRIATAYMVEALRIVDAYQFRVSAQNPASADSGPPKKKAFKSLAVPPAKPGDKPWWDKFWTDSVKQRDRAIFA
jgi:hypothetical protein